MTQNAASPGAFRFVINGQTYDPSLVAFEGVLGNVDQWTINATAAGGHVFHIHVNPFRVVGIRNPAGNSIFDPSGGCTAAERATGDTEYCGMKDVIRDTFFVKPGYKRVMRTPCQHFTGEFVMHCHILDHEDQRMMANVAVVSPATALLQRMTDPMHRHRDRLCDGSRRAMAKSIQSSMLRYRRFARRTRRAAESQDTTNAPLLIAFALAVLAGGNAFPIRRASASPPSG
nr:multicopper oxidase domain-containing protein [Caballeronia sp. GAFFF1]